MAKTAQPIRRRASGSTVKHPPMQAEQLGAVADLFAVLAEPSRLTILQLLQAGPLGAGEIVERSGLKQANVSKQLGILQTAGLIDRRAEGNRAIFSIKLPLIFDLCELVCHGMAEQAAERAAALRR